MSNVFFKLSVKNVLGGVPEKWPSSESSFIRKTKLTSPPSLGVTICLSQRYEQDLKAEVDSVEYFLEAGFLEANTNVLPEDTYIVNLEMQRDSISMDYFMDQKKGWQPTKS